MNSLAPGDMVLHDDWSNLARHRDLPDIDHDRLRAYRMGRLKSALADHDAAMCLLVNPISLRYAADYTSYALFQSHIPTTYMFLSQDGPSVIHGVWGPPPGVDEVRPARPLSYFDGGRELPEAARLLADDVVAYLNEIGTDNRRVAVEYVNPGLTQALMQRGLDVIDGVMVAEEARIIKSEDEIACMKWSIGVAELGIAKIKEALKPGVTEVRLWALLNYANLANSGGWHEGQMLVSGPRTNPWCQVASDRKIESGDLVGFDTDMVGPYGYFADISRTLHCGPAPPTRRQKQLYRLAREEIDHNLALIRPGVTFTDLQQQAWPVPGEFHENAYSCIIHGVGMCDEYPRVAPLFRGVNMYDGTLQSGMVICVESYMGAVGEPNGVKLEEQVLVTNDGYETLTGYPLEERLLD